MYGVAQKTNYRDERVNVDVVAVNGRTFDKEDIKTEIKWNVFPNPVVDILYITGLEGYYTIKIVDTVGQVVASVNGTSTGVELDMSGKSAGMYLIKIESQGKSVTRKLIKK